MKDSRRGVDKTCVLYFIFICLSFVFIRCNLLGERRCFFCSTKYKLQVSRDAIFSAPMGNYFLTYVSSLTQRVNMQCFNSSSGCLSA